MPVVTLLEGNTPLVRGWKSGPATRPGSIEVYLKDSKALNPTGSF